MRLYVDGQLAKDALLPARSGTEQPAGLAIGRLVEGGNGCDGLIDEVRLSRIARPPPGLPSAPPQSDAETIAIWHFDQETDLGLAAFVPDKTPLDPAAYPLHAHRINRDRIYDFYAKQALHALAQNPRPALLPLYPGLDSGKFGHWGNQNEETWRDGRWNEMDTGSLQAGVFTSRPLRFQPYSPTE